MYLKYEIDNNSIFEPLNTIQIEDVLINIMGTTINKVRFEKDIIPYYAFICRRPNKYLAIDLLTIDTVINNNFENLLDGKHITRIMNHINNLGIFLNKVELFSDDTENIEVKELFITGQGAEYAIVEHKKVNENSKCYLIFHGMRGEWKAGEWYPGKNTIYSGTRILGFKPPSPVNKEIAVWTSDINYPINIFCIEAKLNKLN